MKNITTTQAVNAMSDFVSIMNDFINVLKKEYKDIDYILIENTCFGRALPNIRISIMPVDYRMEYLSFREWIIKNENDYEMSINADHIIDSIKKVMWKDGFKVNIKKEIYGYIKDSYNNLELKTAFNLQ